MPNQNLIKSSLNQQGKRELCEFDATDFVSVSQGGTGSTNPVDARIALGVPSLADLTGVDDKTDGSVTVHNDVTDAGSGQIITDTERNLLNSALQSETVTSLTLVGNILTYTPESGPAQVFDLSIYLDDTNLARLQSGVLDAQTGIATFTRDDNTTFPLDLSQLSTINNASQLEFTPCGDVQATDVQAAICELDTEKYSVTNPSGFETPLQLSARDNVNRNRNNHTGTQPASTISDFDTEVSNNSNVASNTAKVSATGPVSTHSDVNTTGATSGDLLSYDGTNWVPESTSNGYTIFSIWAEDNSGLAQQSREWSFGNGSKGDVNIVLPIDAELFAVSFDTETGSGLVAMDIYKNDALGATTKQFSPKDFEIFTTPFPFIAGDCLGFRTNSVSGDIVTDARVAAWFRVRSTPASTSVLNDLLDVSVNGITSGQILQYNGSAFTPITIGSAALNNTSDFATAAQGALAATALQAETNTSLTLVGNTLTYQREQGPNQTIDLSPYIDDTNLSRITSGTFNQLTNTLTLIRSDNTTFDIAGFNITPTSKFKAYAADNDPKGFISTNEWTYLNLPVTLPTTADYEIHWSMDWSLDTANDDFIASIEVDGVSIAEYRIEPKDSAGTGEDVERIDTGPGNFINSATDQKLPLNGTWIGPLAAGARNISIVVTSSNGSEETAIYRGLLKIEEF